MKWKILILITSYNRSWGFFSVIVPRCITYVCHMSIGHPPWKIFKMPKCLSSLDNAFSILMHCPTRFVLFFFFYPHHIPSRFPWLNTDYLNTKYSHQFFQNCVCNFMITKPTNRNRRGRIIKLKWRGFV